MQPFLLISLPLSLCGHRFFSGDEMVEEKGCPLHHLTTMEKRKRRDVKQQVNSSKKKLCWNSHIRYSQVFTETKIKPTFRSVFFSRQFATSRAIITTAKKERMDLRVRGNEKGGGIGGREKEKPSTILQTTSTLRQLGSAEDLGKKKKNPIRRRQLQVPQVFGGVAAPTCVGNGKWVFSFCLHQQQLALKRRTQIRGKIIFCDFFFFWGGVFFLPNHEILVK